MNRPSASSVMRAILAVLLVLGVFASVGMLMFFEIPKDNRDLVSYLINTVVAAGALMVINYVFGSSSGSAARAKTIDEIVTGPTSIEANPVDPTKDEITVFKP